MKYTPLPLEENLAQKTSDEARQIIETLIVETMNTRGFQLILGILRNLDARAMMALRSGMVKPERVGELLGRIQCIEEIRRSLQALLPVPEQANVDFYDGEEEAFVNVDKGTVAGTDDL